MLQTKKLGPFWGGSFCLWFVSSLVFRVQGPDAAGNPKSVGFRDG